MTHIAIQEALDGKAVDWMEKVSDEQGLRAATRKTARGFAWIVVYPPGWTRPRPS
jgi:hypothetical protein